MAETTKTVYQYGLDGVYAGTLTLDDTDKDPKGNFNIPANCTETAPTITAAMVNTWNGTAWVQTADPTNVYVYYNNGLSYKTELSTYTVQTGEVIFTSTPTTEQLESAFSGYDAAVLAQAKTTKESQIQALLDQTNTQCLLYLEGNITEAKYANMKSARAAWAAAITSIEACTTVDAVNAVTYSTTEPSVS